MDEEDTKITCDAKETFQIFILGQEVADLGNATLVHTIILHYSSTEANMMICSNASFTWQWEIISLIRR
jgi:hypothetical protein